MSHAGNIGINPTDISSNERKKRLSITFSDDIAQKLDWLASIQSCTLNEAIRRSIATEVYIRQELEADSKILVQKKDGTVRELVFR